MIVVYIIGLLQCIMVLDIPCIYQDEYLVIFSISRLSCGCSKPSLRAWLHLLDLPCVDIRYILVGSTSIPCRSRTTLVSGGFLGHRGFALHRLSWFL